MSTWQEKTADIQKKIDQIFSGLQKDNNSLLLQVDSSARTSLTNLIKTGGLGSSSEQAIRNMNLILKEIENSIIKPLSSKLKESTTKLDITTLLGRTGQLQQEIIQLRDELKEAKDDADNQIARDSALRTAEGAVSKHQLFLFGKPIRQESIPYLWTVAALLFFIGLAGIFLMAPSIGQQNIFGVGSAMGRARNTLSGYMATNEYGPSFGEQIATLFGNYYILGMTIFSLVVVVTVLILKIIGKL